jgi:hypothetical protein
MPREPRVLNTTPNFFRKLAARRRKGLFGHRPGTLAMSGTNLFAAFRGNVMSFVPFCKNAKLGAPFTIHCRFTSNLVSPTSAAPKGCFLNLNERQKKSWPYRFILE